jgi:hypothetical protein
LRATVAGPGARELWPAGERIVLQHSDKRDGTVTVSRRAPPLAFTANFACRFTGDRARRGRSCSWVGERTIE